MLVRWRRIWTFIDCWWDCFPLEYSQGLKMLNTELYSAAQLCPALCDRVDCGPPGSSSVAFPRQEHRSVLPFPLAAIFLTQGLNSYISCISCIGGWILHQWATWEDRVIISSSNPPRLGVYPREVSTHPYKNVYMSSQSSFIYNREENENNPNVQPLTCG